MSALQLLRAWLIILPAMIANGIFRDLVLRQMVGPTVVELLSTVSAVLIIVVITRYVLRRLAGASILALVRASLGLVALTVAFELLFGHYVDARSWSELAANYAVWRGHLWPVVLATLAFMPFLWGRWSLPEPRVLSPPLPRMRN